MMQDVENESLREVVVEEGVGEGLGKVEDEQSYEEKGKICW